MIFAVITGASQGIGRTIAVELSKCLGSGSTVILIARNAMALNDLKKMLVSVNVNVSVNVIALDLSNPDISEYENIFKDISVDYDYALIFHNAGQIGTLKSTIELTDIQKWRDYFDLNFFSVSILNSILVKRMRNLTQQIIVVNISSLCGIEPFANMAMYGSAKAARNLYFKVFAVEESDVKVLNYCPGPVDTPMMDEVIDNVIDEGVKKNFVDLRNEKNLLTPTQTVLKLLTILQEDKYKSGDVIDYYDIV